MISYKNTHYFKQVDFVTPPIRKTLAQTWEIKRSPPFIWSDADRTADAVLENHYFSTTKFYLIDLNGKNLLFLTSKCMKKTTTIWWFKFVPEFVQKENSIGFIKFFYQTTKCVQHDFKTFSYYAVRKLEENFSLHLKQDRVVKNSWSIV